MRLSDVVESLDRASVPESDDLRQAVNLVIGFFKRPQSEIVIWEIEGIQSHLPCYLACQRMELWAVDHAVNRITLLIKFAKLLARRR